MRPTSCVLCEHFSDDEKNDFFKWSHLFKWISDRFHIIDAGRGVMSPPASIYMIMYDFPESKLSPAVFQRVTLKFHRRRTVFSLRKRFRKGVRK